MVLIVINTSLTLPLLISNNRPEIMIYPELISSTRDNGTLRSARTYRIHAFLTITNLTYIQTLHHSEIKYQGEALSILCAMSTHGLQPEDEFPNFLAIQISNAVSQTLACNYATGCKIRPRTPRNSGILRSHGHNALNKLLRLFNRPLFSLWKA